MSIDDNEGAVNLECVDNAQLTLRTVCPTIITDARHTYAWDMRVC